VKLRIVAVGRVKERALRDSIDEYLGRVRRYVPVEEIELADEAGAKLALQMRKHVAGAHLVALDMGGEERDSVGFARALEQLASTGKGDVAFVIGGKDGLPPEIRREATKIWSLSRLTFPHRLARLVLVEQLYRAMTVLRGEPYAQ
jgi:23S rRNA (pseudouridine1915-N3)-methyltransferase